MTRFAVLLLLLMGAAAPAVAGSAQDVIVETYMQLAKASDPGFAGFSAARGREFFLADHTGGKPDTPSCTTCHSKNAATTGQTRAGKAIEPMAASANPSRYADMEKTEKWFARNCSSVLGRVCTPAEKGDFITFMLSQ